MPSAKKVSAESVTPGPSTSTVVDDDCVITGEVSESPLKFYPVTIDWQQRACQQLGLQYHAPTRVRQEGPMSLLHVLICVVGNVYREMETVCSEHCPIFYRI